MTTKTKAPEPTAEPFAFLDGKKICIISWADDKYLHTFCGRDQRRAGATVLVPDADDPRICRECVNVIAPVLRQSQPQVMPKGPRLINIEKLRKLKSLVGQMSFAGAVWDGLQWVDEEESQ